MRTIIVAWDDNKLIGKDGGLPWHIKEDLQHFKRKTVGHAIIMGRKTWDSFGGKPLPDREHIVISRNWTDKPPGINCVGDLKTAIALGVLLYPDNNEVFIIGGAQIYQQALEQNVVDRILVSKVHGQYKGDTYFPTFDESKWQKRIVVMGEKFDIVEYTKNETVSSISGRPD